MNFEFTEEQHAIRDMARDSLTTISRRKRSSGTRPVISRRTSYAQSANSVLPVSMCAKMSAVPVSGGSTLR
jgi:hypothetical protein